MSSDRSSCVAVVGDVHGHLQLALCMLARWQRERGRAFDAVLLCGDVGTFTEDSQLDNATRRHARDNPCELEFLTQWATTPQAPWLDAIFQPEPDGLGLTCPAIMVHGNHEGFAHLERLFPHRRRSTEPVAIDSLPAVDTNGHILFLPPGWVIQTEQRITIAGLGGIEPGQRRVNYHSLAYLDDDSVEHLMLMKPVDILITHQGPAGVQGDHGSPTLDVLFERGFARQWFHGHSTPVRTPTTAGRTTVVPLGDVAFKHGTPGLHGWAILEFDGNETSLVHEPPPFWRESRVHQWLRLPDGRLVHPDLIPFVD